LQWVPHGPSPSEASPNPEVKSRLSRSPSSRRRFPRVRTQTRLLPPPPNSDPCRRSLGAPSSGPLQRRANRAKCGTSFPFLPRSHLLAAGKEVQWRHRRRGGRRSPTSRRATGQRRRLSAPPSRQRAGGAPVSRDREPPDAAPSSEYLGLGTEGGGDIFASSCATEKKTLSFCRLLLLSEASCSSLHFSVEPLSECRLPNCCLPSCWKHVSACSYVPR
jgi:hypothetical protein